MALYEISPLNWFYLSPTHEKCIWRLIIFIIYALDNKSSDFIVQCTCSKLAVFEIDATCGDINLNIINYYVAV